MAGIAKSSKKRAVLVAVNERGHVVGQSHPRAVLTDHEVELLLELRGEGYSLGWLARKFEVSKGCVQGIVSGRNRSQVIDRVRRIRSR